MTVDRRDFLKIAGLAAAGLSTVPVAQVLTEGTAMGVEEKAPAATAGKRWAMVVDMRKLTPEEVEHASHACHEAHNVPNIVNADGSTDTKHEIKWLWGGEYEFVFPDATSEFLAANYKEKEFPILCNHCASPPCVRVCPTQATFKRADGIVVMDMHRCIGCRFCMAGCPYGSRSFNFMDPRPFIKKTNPLYPTRMKGVVEKCNFCAERLFKGLKPACVEAVHSGALVFGDLDDPSSDVRRLIQEHYTIQRKPSLGTGPSVYYIL
jgi:molybdopterin-containing oxidoreductase family iron-sulfur binding subunit